MDKGCLTAWDVDLFAAYCDAVATYHDCREKMGTAYVVQGSVKNAVPSPYWRVMTDCIATMVKIGGRFGLTPSDRAAIDTAENKPVSPASRFFT
jgi:P27 family predicted phage terminase small subunit